MRWVSAKLSHASTLNAAESRQDFGYCLMVSDLQARLCPEQLCYTAVIFGLLTASSGDASGGIPLRSTRIGIK